MEAFKALSKVYTGLTLPLYYPFTRDASLKEKTAPTTRAKRVGDTWTRVDDEDHEDVVPVYESIAHLMKEFCTTKQDKRAIGYRKILKKETSSGGRVKVMLEPEFTFLNRRQMDTRIQNIMKGLVKHGVRPKDRVSIFMETRMEWMLVAQALYRMNATIATLYATLGEEGIVHGINELESTHIVTSNELLPKLAKLKPQLHHLKTIIAVRDVIDGNAEPLTVEGIDGCDIILLEDLEKVKDSEVDLTCIPMPTKDDIALIMYTSGSTGVPKGVLLKHANLAVDIRHFAATLFRLKFSEDACHIAYLPLAHIFELQAAHIFLSMGLTVGFGSPMTVLSSSPGLMEGCLSDVAVLKPEAMAAVPLMLDKIRKAVEGNFAKKGYFAKGVFDYAMAYKSSWNQSGHRTPLIDRLITKKIRKLFGGRIKCVVSGGAVLSPDTQLFTRTTLGIAVVVAYAATETGGAGTVADWDDESIGTVGPPQYGSKIKLQDWEEGGYRVTDEPNPRGEILVKAASVASGYFKRPEETAESFSQDEDGEYWFRTGDIGEFTEDGSLRIIDRMKDLTKLQFGEYVSPAKIEAALKCCPLVDNVCIVADGNHNFTVAIVVPNVTALKQIATAVTAGEKSLEELSVQQMCSDQRVIDAALKELSQFSSRSGLVRHETPQKITIVPDSWTPDSGLVTAAFKLRRKQIRDFYQKDIQRMYS